MKRIFKERPCAACKGKFIPLSPLSKFCRVECYIEGNTKKAGEDECWNWFGSHTAFRYARCRFAPHYIDCIVGRVILGILGKPHLNACHHCDNPECVNPKHLFIGTQAENLKDMSAKGRAHRGETHRFAKLNDEQVKVIKTSELGPTALGRQFGVSPAAVCAVRSGKSWSHV